MTRMTWRRSVTLTMAALLLLAACTDKEPKQPEGQLVTVVAGGGTNPSATKATDLDLTGTAKDLEVGRDGTVRLLTSDGKRAYIWQFKPNGEAQRIDIDPSITEVSQLAVADDGTLYVSNSEQVSRIATNGKVTRVVGNGKVGFTADGAPAADSSTADLYGITVDGDGRLIYSESIYYRAQNQTLGLVRRVEADGRIATIAGRTGPLPENEYSKGIVRAVAPPDGTKALGWAVPGILGLASLATADDGQILLQANRGVLGVAPDGIIKAVVRRRDAEAAPVGARPFTREGDAADADPRFLMDTSITAGGGYVSMPVTGALPTLSPPIPAAFGWNGSYTPSQQEIIDAARQSAVKSEAPSLLRLAQPDGSVTTAAWPADGGAVRAGRVYLLMAGSGHKLMIGSMSLPS
jgi:hypothetical protein